MIGGCVQKQFLFTFRYKLISKSNIARKGFGDSGLDCICTSFIVNGRT